MHVRRSAHICCFLQVNMTVSFPQVQRCGRTSCQHVFRPCKNQPAAVSVWTQWSQICVCENRGLFHLSYQIGPAGPRLYRRWASQLPVLNQSFIQSGCVFLICVLSHRPAEIQYILTLDALRGKARALFIRQDDKSDRRITRKFGIKDRESQCVHETFVMLASTLIFFKSTWGCLSFLTCKKNLLLTFIKSLF